jgi:hypothetical protein
VYGRIFSLSVSVLLIFFFFFFWTNEFSHYVTSGWTSAVRGAVLYGVEQSQHENLVIARPQPRAYGVIFTGDDIYGLLPCDSSARLCDPQIEKTLSLNWLISPDDFNIPGTPTELDIDWVFRLPEKGPKMFKLQIAEHVPLPERYGNNLHNIGQDVLRKKQELIEITSSVCDLSHIPKQKFR